MASPRLIRQDSITHVERAPGVTVSGMVGEESGATQISSGITTFAPGCSNTTHFHNAEESVIVIEGEGILVIGSEEHHVKPNDAAFITPGVRLAWDTCCSAFAGRQVLYERFFQADAVRNAVILYNMFDLEPMTDYVREFLNQE